MADPDRSQGLLWRFKRPSAGKGTAELDPANALYRLFTNSRNPFVHRAIAPQPEQTERTAAEVADLSRLLASQRLYHVGPGAAGGAFTRRQLKHPDPPPTPAPKYQEPARLLGDPARLPFLVDEFFHAVLERLKADPNSFYTVIDELTELLRVNNVRIKIYEAYQELQDWDDLMDTLAEIAHYPSLETFDLFCSALLAYYDLVNPPA